MIQIGLNQSRFAAASARVMGSVATLYYCAVRVLLQKGLPSEFILSPFTERNN